MRRARWLAEWANEEGKPAIYHCISRVVDRRFVFGDEEREQFRMFMRMYENFSGCRVLSYCVMSNHFHVLLEVPPMPKAGLPDTELLRRLGFLYSEMVVKEVAEELRSAENAQEREAIHARYAHRFHSLSEFMKGLLIRFTRWFNRTHQRKGTLWEERFKSVIVESGTAARTMAAYIDLNPVRAGMVADPADYRWSSYGEAVGGGRKGNGKKAREGLVRAYLSDEGVGFETAKWRSVSCKYRKLMGFALARKGGKEGSHQDTRQKTYAAKTEEKEGEGLPEMGVSGALMKRVRYFSDGAVIGGKSFVNQAFASGRERFSERRRDGARKMRGMGKAPSDPKERLWSIRDLRMGV